MKAMIKDALKAAPKYIVMVVDPDVEHRKLGLDALNIILDEDCDLKSVWFFTAINAKSMLKQMKQYSNGYRVMFPFSIKLEPLSFIPNKKF